MHVINLRLGARIYLSGDESTFELERYGSSIAVAEMLMYLDWHLNGTYFKFGTRVRVRRHEEHRNCMQYILTLSRHRLNREESTHEGCSYLRGRC